jgi:hypothetical protein
VTAVTGVLFDNASFFGQRSPLLLHPKIDGRVVRSQSWLGQAPSRVWVVGPRRLFCGHLRRGLDLHTTDGRREFGAQICFFVVFGAVRDLLLSAKTFVFGGQGTQAARPSLGRVLSWRSGCLWRGVRSWSGGVSLRLELRLVEAELRADEVMRPSFWTRLGMTYVLTITVYLGAVSVSRELPNRFASLDQCRDYFAEYVKQLRHPPHAKVAFECEQRP